MKKKIKILIIILILIIIIFKFYKSKKDILNDIIIFSLWNDIGKDKEYVINPQKDENIQINIFQTIENGIYKKIAPGSYGKFTIRLIKTKEASCEIILREITKKPQNLIFKINNQTYNSFEEMKEKISKEIIEKNEVTINWNWKYDTNQEEDMEDTNDGEKAQKYLFEIKAIIED